MVHGLPHYFCYFEVGGLLTAMDLFDGPAQRLVSLAVGTKTTQSNWPPFLFTKANAASLIDL